MKNKFNFKNITGEEAGKLMLKNELHLFGFVTKNFDDIKDLKSNQVKKMFEDVKFLSESDWRQINESISQNPKYIADYNKYVDIETISERVRYHQIIAHNNIDSLVMRLIYFIDKSISIYKNLYLEKMFMPKIVSQLEYDTFIKKDREKKMNTKASIVDIIFSTIDFFTEKFKDQQKTPFDKYFKQLKKEKITNKFILQKFSYYKLQDIDETKNEIYENIDSDVFYNPPPLLQSLTDYTQNKKACEYNQQEIFGVEALKEAGIENKFDLLYDSFLFDNFNGTKKEVFEIFITDYSELFKAIIDYLKKFKGLDVFMSLPTKKYLTSKISYSQLYEAKLPDILNFIDNSGLTDPMGTSLFLAVSKTSFTGNILKPNEKKEGFFESSLIEDKFFLHNLIKSDFPNDFKKTYDEIVISLQDTFTAFYFHETLQNRTNIEELIAFKPNINYLTQKIRIYNNARFNLAIEINNYMPAFGDKSTKMRNEIVKLIEEIYPPIRITETKPSLKGIKRLQDKIDKLEALTFASMREILYFDEGETKCDDR